MTKEEVLVRFKEEENELSLLLNQLRKDRDKAKSARDPVGISDTNTMMSVFEAQIKKLQWARGLVEKIRPQDGSAPPVPQSEQNSVTAGWTGAITGELKQKK